MRMKLALAMTCAVVTTVVAQSDPTWRAPQDGFKMIGNLYYVGTAGLSSYLITTPVGHIMIDSTLNDGVPLIKANVEKLGFKMSDVKILLSSHAHFDHVEGHAAMKRATGAEVMALGEDAAAIASGKDNSALGGPPWEPTPVARVLADGDTVTLGGMTLVAHLTPGHTKGCTTWTTTIQDGGQSYPAIFVCSTTINGGVTLLGNTRHPGIDQAYARTFAFLKTQKPQLFFAPHPGQFGMAEKLPRLKAGSPNPFIDPAGYAAYVERGEKVYLDQLANERKSASGAKPR